jgi:hypothetical protein
MAGLMHVGERGGNMRSKEHTILGALPTTGSGPSDGLDQVEASPTRSVALPLLSAGTMITLHTRNTCYHMQVLDGAARRVLITGGSLFPEGTEVEVVGAADEEHVRAGWMVEGLQLELSTAHGPVLTSMVMSVCLDDDPTGLQHV